MNRIINAIFGLVAIIGLIFFVYTYNYPLAWYIDSPAISLVIGGTSLVLLLAGKATTFIKAFSNRGDEYKEVLSLTMLCNFLVGMTGSIIIALGKINITPKINSWTFVHDLGISFLPIITACIIDLVLLIFRLRKV